MAGALTILRRDPAILARNIRDDAVKSLATMQTRRAKVEADVAAAEAAQALAAGDAEASPEALEASTRILRDARDLLAAFDERIIPAARQNIAAADRVVVEREKEGAYEAAEAKRRAAAARLVKEYPGLAKTYSDLVRAVEEADMAVEAANTNLPEGREPLLTVEQLTRDTPAKPRAIVSDEVKDIWHHQSGDRVNNQAWVKNGHYSPPRHGEVQYLGSDRCRQIPKRVVVSIPAVQGELGPRLAATVLPPLRFSDAAPPEPETQYLAVDTADEAA